MLRLFTFRNIGKVFSQTKRTFSFTPPIIMPPFPPSSGNHFPDWYGAIIGICAISGAIYGAYSSVNDIIKNNHYEKECSEKYGSVPRYVSEDAVVVNVVLSTGLGFCCGMVVGLTFPISGPAMLYYCCKK